MRWSRSSAVVVGLVTVLLLGSYLAYTEFLVREIRAEAVIHSRMYALIQKGLISPEEGAETQVLLDLQAQAARLDIPFVVLDQSGTPVAGLNLPFEVDLRNPAHHPRLRAYARKLGRQNAPVVEPGFYTVYFGAPPVVGWLRWVPWLQVGGGLVILTIAAGIIRANLRAERDRTWASMARELAHQMGTPLSSLTGWLELLRMPLDTGAPLATPERIATEIAADVERLERVSRRFELIGKPPALEPVSVAGVLREMDRYIRPRVPRLAKGVELRTRASANLPPVAANSVLLVWALENLVKNALDALAGRGGRILVAATQLDARWVVIHVADNGPGIAPEVHGRIFEPGVTTKSRGWGVGLSLTRRIVTEYHRGRIAVRNRRSGGTVFEIRLRVAAERQS